MIDLKTFAWKQGVLLAPMEDITDLSYREICREYGAEMVYTEFVNSDGLIRGCKRGRAKMKLSEQERPAAIQIYGNDTDAMVRSAELSLAENPDLIDINAGCWVKKVSKRGAGAGLLKDPAFMEAMVAQVVRAVSVPVTVKTRIGWDENSINIIEIAKRLEQVGVRALTVHCRTRAQGHSGEPDWSWIPKIKAVVSIPIIVNGGILSAADVRRVFDETDADGVMIARAAIGSPWIFREIQELLAHGKVLTPLTLGERIATALRHLASSVALKGERRAITAFRKYYRGYFNGIPGVFDLRMQLMRQSSFAAVETCLHNFAQNSSNSTVSLGSSSSTSHSVGISFKDTV